MATAELTFLYGEFAPKCTHFIDKEFVGYQTLQYMDGGAVELHVGPRRYDLTGRWFWSAYPGPRIRFHAAAGHTTWVHRYIAFRGPLVARWTADGLFPVAPQRPSSGMNPPPRFDELLARSRRTDRRSQLRAIHLLEGLLLDLADQRADEAPVGEPWLARVLRDLSVAAEEGGVVDYAAMAADLNMAERTFRRHFQQATGMSPHDYLLQSRIGAARRLLTATDQPIGQIAERLGYRDIYFFSRQFRALTGVPPTTYRRSRQG